MKILPKVPFFGHYFEAIYSNVYDIMFFIDCGKLGGYCGYLKPEEPKIKRFSGYVCGKPCGFRGKLSSIMRKTVRIMSTAIYV